MLAADVAIAVTVPEPPAIETTYRFLRAAFRRRLRRALLARQAPLVDPRARAGRARDAAARRSSSCTAREDGPQLAELAWAEAQRLRVQLVVNQTRVRTDLELGAWMSGLVARHYGVALDELGHIEHDDTVWLTVRRNKPLLVDSPTCKSARNLERIARRVLALAAAQAGRSGRGPAADPDRGADALRRARLTRSASDEEIRRAYKRQREIYATGGLATVVAARRASSSRAAQRKLDEAYDTLLDPVRRRAYDLSTFPEPEPRGPLRARRRGRRSRPSS